MCWGEFSVIVFVVSFFSFQFCDRIKTEIRKKFDLKDYASFRIDWPKVQPPMSRSWSEFSGKIAQQQRSTLKRRRILCRLTTVRVSFIHEMCEKLFRIGFRINNQSFRNILRIIRKMVDYANSRGNARRDVNFFVCVCACFCVYVCVCHSSWVCIERKMNCFTAFLLDWLVNPSRILLLLLLSKWRFSWRLCIETRWKHSSSGFHALCVLYYIRDSWT